MPPTFFRYLLWLLVWNHAMWFFGNLYEQIVDVPNLLSNPVRARALWGQYHQLTNPIYYHVPNTLLAIIGMLLGHAYACKRVDRSVYRLFTQATLCSAAGIVLTGGIVLGLNVKLFLSSTPLPEAAIRRLAVYWLLGNGLRLGLVLAAGVYFLKTLQTIASSDNRNSL